MSALTGLPHQAHSETSRAAAAQYLPHARTARERVYWTISASENGMTDEEVQDALGMNPSTQRPRRVELVEIGIVEDSGRTRPTRSGMDAVVWVQCDPTIPYPHDWRKPEQPTAPPDLLALLRDGTATTEQVRQLLHALQDWWKPRAKTLWPQQGTSMLLAELDRK